MKEKQQLGEFIYQLRKEKHLSQSELGALLGVSNKAVSKWETGEANPELGMIKQLSAVFGVTADELLDGKRSEQEPQAEDPAASGSVYLKFDRISLEHISKKKTKKGLPYVHINFRGKAHGIVAIGLYAKGVVSIGLLSIGILSLGLLSIGLLALGVFSIALLALGAIAVGVAAAGGVAIGLVAVGGIAVGYLSVGGVSIGYYAHTGLDGFAYGKKIVYHSSKYFFK